MTIHLFPIEPIEERYSADWYRWWPEALKKAGFPLAIYTGDRLKGQKRGEAIQHGQFLDAIDTQYYKAIQLAEFVQQVHKGRVEDGDIVLLLDGWNPAVTSLAYIRDVVKIKYKIVLVLHAGTWDPHDHLSACGMGKWACWNEIGWISAADSVLVATEFHRRLLHSFFGDLDDDGYKYLKIRVTGFPLVLSELDKYKIPWSEKEDMVVFPHRLAIEKQPVVFEQIKEIYYETYPEDLGKIKWLRTQDAYSNKESLYRMLAKSKVAFSAARQETWGIVQLESWYLGAVPVVPDRLSYKELYPSEHKYRDIAEAIKMIHRYVHSDKGVDFNPARDPRLAFRSIVDELKRM